LFRKSFQWPSIEVFSRGLTVKRWIPRLIAHLEKKLFGIPDFFIAFGSPTDANTFCIFGFGRGPPRWAWQPLIVLQFFKNGWRCGTLEDHISGSTRPIWARVCLLERSDNLFLGKKYEIWKFTVFSRFGVEGNIRYVISFMGHLTQSWSYSGLNNSLWDFQKRPTKVCTLSGFFHFWAV
jgi:hypothetical protein